MNNDFNALNDSINENSARLSALYNEVQKLPEPTEGIRRSLNSIRINTDALHNELKKLREPTEGIQKRLNAMSIDIRALDRGLETLDRVERILGGVERALGPITSIKNEITEINKNIKRARELIDEVISSVGWLLLSCSVAFVGIGLAQWIDKIIGYPVRDFIKSIKISFF